jgi:hypothetical protein
MVLIVKRLSKRFVAIVLIPQGGSLVALAVVMVGIAYRLVRWLTLSIVQCFIRHAVRSDDIVTVRNIGNSVLVAHTRLHITSRHLLS